MIRLTEGEWAILEVLWSGERFPLGEIVSALRPKMNWRRNTVHTYLTRMESKGLVKIHRETEPHQYAAAVSRSRRDLIYRSSGPTPFIGESTPWSTW